MQTTSLSASGCVPLALPVKCARVCCSDLLDLLAQVLEIHLLHKAGKFGGFYEDLLMPGY